MFASLAGDKKKTPVESKTQRDNSSPDGKAGLDQNPVWQSLALRPTAIQAKLAISQPDDPYEQEADRVADRVMRMAAPPLSDNQISFRLAPFSAALRKCHCEAEEEKKLQRKERSVREDPPPVASTLVDQSLSFAGEALDSDTREFMEARFGHDFGPVRVHTGTHAAASAAAVNASAYTLGSHITFGAGAYSPSTPAGKRLLAHELTHVVQQRQGQLRTSRTIQRSPRTLPARAGPSNFLLTNEGDHLRARTTHFPGVYRPSGTISAVAGAGMTLRGLARMLLPIYARAALAPGGVAAPTEDELAKALLDYNRVLLAPPAMSAFRAGTMLRLPVELDPSPGPVSHRRNDWLVDPDDVRTHSAVVTAAEAPLVDQAAAAAAAPTSAADVTAFTTAVVGAALQGTSLHARVIANPFAGSPLATMVLASMNAVDRFEASMSFMATTTNPEVTMLESIAPGFNLLRALRSALTTPPIGFAPARERVRAARVAMLPQDPVIAGLSPDFLNTLPPGGALDRPNVIFFRGGRSSIDASEQAKIPALQAANPGPVTLVGFASEEEEPSLATARTHAVEAVLRRGSVVVDTERAGVTAAGARPSIGSIAYPEMRSVRVDRAAPASEPDCRTMPSTSEACLPNHAALDSRFIAAHARARAIVEAARIRMGNRTDRARDAAMRNRFGVVSHPHLLTRLNMLHATILSVIPAAPAAARYQCGTTCDSACNSGSLAYSGGPGASPLMVVCDGMLSTDLETAASVIIHESCHATQGMRQANPAASGNPADWAYRWERMSATINEMSPTPTVSHASLDNADSYTQFVMDLRDPALIPAGSQPIDEAPADDFQGAWTATHRNRVRHGLANCQKWLVWSTQYLGNTYNAARTGGTDPTYGFVSTRFGGFTAVPGNADRAKLAGIQSTLRVVRARLLMAMRIEHAAAGAATSFGASSPLLLLVGTDALRISSDQTRGELFVRKLIEASPEIDSAQSAAYSGLVIDIRDQYFLDH